MNKKLSLVLLSGLIAFQSNALIGNDVDPRVTTAAVLLASGVVMAGAKKVQHATVVKKASEQTGIAAQDAANVIGISASCFALSGMVNPEMQKGLIRFSVRAPIAAAVTGITTTKTFQSIVKEIPLIGQYLGCDNPDCQGVCDQCRLTKGITTIALYFAVDAALNSLMKESAVPK